MRLRLLSLIVLAGALAGVPAAAEAAAEGAAPDAAFVTPGVPHPGSDQIWWVPTFAQAEEVARHTGRMVLVMGSVGDWNGY